MMAQTPCAIGCAIRTGLMAQSFHALELDIIGIG
jgi:hypothetical protein